MSQSDIDHSRGLIDIEFTIERGAIWRAPETRSRTRGGLTRFPHFSVLRRPVAGNLNRAGFAKQAIMDAVALLRRSPSLRVLF
jgi:hypothetical protein